MSYMGSLKEKEAALKGAMPTMRVIIDPKVHQKIMYWVNKAPGEISGLGKLSIFSDGTMFVNSAILLEQENTGSTTEIEPAAIAKAMFESREEPGHLNFWWHSHVNMGVFWSGTDLDTIREIGEQGFVLATVFNKKNEMLSAFYRKAEGVFPEFYASGLPTQIQSLTSQEEINAWDEQFTAKCKTKTYTPIVYDAEYYKRWANQTPTESNRYAEDDYDREEPRPLAHALEGSQESFAIEDLEDDATERELENELDPVMIAMYSEIYEILRRKHCAVMIKKINATKFHNKKRKRELREWAWLCLREANLEHYEKKKHIEAANEETGKEVTL